MMPETSAWLFSEAQKTGAAAGALNEFAERYYHPIFAYMNAITRDPQKTEDLVNDFMLKVVIQRGLLRKFDRTRRFRPYLKQCLRNFIWEDARRKVLPADPLDDTGVQPPPVYENPGRSLDDAWARHLIARALERVREACLSKGQETHFALFVDRYLSPGSVRPSWETLGADRGLSGKDATNRAFTVVRRFRTAFMDVLVEETGSRAAAEEEWNALLSLLGEGGFTMESPQDLVHSCSSGQIQELLSLGEDEKASEGRIRSEDARRVRDFLESGASGLSPRLIEDLVAGQVASDDLRGMKGQVKRALAAAGPTEARWFTLIYHGVLASGMVHHHANLSSIPFAERVPFYADLGSILGADPLGGLFSRAAEMEEPA